jgi:hypothetical protein
VLHQSQGGVGRVEHGPTGNAGGVGKISEQPDVFLEQCSGEAGKAVQATDITNSVERKAVSAAA